MTYSKLISYSITVDGRIERRLTEVPAVCRPAPITIRITDGTNKHEALRLLRQFIDELEAAHD